MKKQSTYTQLNKALAIDLNQVDSEDEGEEQSHISQLPNIP